MLNPKMRVEIRSFDPMPIRVKKPFLVVVEQATSLLFKATFEKMVAFGSGRQQAINNLKDQMAGAFLRKTRGYKALSTVLAEAVYAVVPEATPKSLEKERATLLALRTLNEDKVRKAAEKFLLHSLAGAVKIVKAGDYDLAVELLENARSGASLAGDMVLTTQVTIESAVLYFRHLAMSSAQDRKTFRPFVKLIKQHQYKRALRLYRSLDTFDREAMVDSRIVEWLRLKTGA
jgi:hypothetical protein